MNTENLSNADYSRLIEVKRELKKNAGVNGKTAFGWARSVLGQVDAVIGRQNRILFLADVFGRVVKSSRDLSDSELFALAMWGRPYKQFHSPVSFDKEFIHDLTILQITYNDQITLPGMPE